MSDGGFQIELDGMAREARPGQTLLDVANAHGVEIPTLCWLAGTTPYVSCRVCVVRDVEADRLVPSCATAAVEGMRIESDSERVRAARRSALELLLSEHVGDCESPCRRGCPAHMDISTMLRQVSDGRLEDAIVTIKDDIALPAILGRICNAMCENACRSNKAGRHVAICQIKREVADRDLESRFPYTPDCAEPSGKRVAVVGAGPAGLAAAYHLLRLGHVVDVLDERAEPGGPMRDQIDRETLPLETLDAEIAVIRRMGAVFRPGARLGQEPWTLDRVAADFDAVALAFGAIDAETAAALGLKYAKRGLLVDKATGATSREGVFACGAAVTPTKVSVQSVAAGHRIAESVDRHLRGAEVPRDVSFTSRLKLEAEELEGWIADREAAGSAPEGTPAPAPTAKSSPAEPLSDAELQAASSRCLLCGCDAESDCRLRDYADDYAIDTRRFRDGARPEFAPPVHFDEFVFDAGKCVKCGICVRLTETRDGGGFHFTGRGFDVRVALPENLTAEERHQIARQIAPLCPTGALVAREGGK